MFIIEYLFDVFWVTGKQLLFFLLPIITIGFLMNFSSRIIETRLCKVLGLRFYLFLFGWLGTSVHEAGHALFCILFRHKINEIKFFSPDLETGTLGYVNHSYNPKSIYQNIGNFFIGIGPILLGGGVIYLFSYFLLDDISITIDSDAELSFSLCVNQGLNILTSLFKISNLFSFKFYLFIYIIFSIGGSISLSPPDLSGSTKGFFSIVSFLLIFNLIFLWLGNFIDFIFYQLSFVFITIYIILIFVLIINWIMAILLSIIIRR